MNRVMFSSSRHDWETPRALFDSLHEEFNFTVDAAANEGNALLPRFWSTSDLPIMYDWTGERVWCNPPYGKWQIPFIRKAATRQADVSVLLIPARTDTAVWHDHIFPCAEVRFIRGRLRFGNASNSAPFPSALIIYRKESA